MRRARVVAVVAVTLAALVAVLLAMPTLTEERTGVAESVPSDSNDPTLVEIGNDRIWPYVGPDQSFDRRASSINVVVRTDPSRVQGYLAGEFSWNRSDDEWADESEVGPAQDDTGVVADELVPWRDAPGASRYTYVADDGWLEERYQLHRGEYFGSRHHVRAYGPSNGNWTAMQAHAEHWDWFTITHTVDSVERSQRRVEAVFLGEPGFEVRQVNYDNGDTYDADRWVTVVTLALAPLLARRKFGGLARRLRGHATERNRRRFALWLSMVALPLVVRFGGVLSERHLPWLSPDAVVALWYPVLVVGVPLTAVQFGRRLPSAEAGVIAGLGVGLGIVLDYAYLGIGVLPIPVAAHRVAVVVAVGLLAAGSASRTDGDDSLWTPALKAGAVLWLVAVVGGHLV